MPDATIGAAIPGDAIPGAGGPDSGAEQRGLVRAFDLDTLIPVPFVDITPVAAGAPVLRFSTRRLQINDQIYEAYLKEITGLNDESKRADSTFENADISIKFLNDRFMNYVRLSEINADYPLYGATCLIQMAYLEENSDVPAYIETVFKGALDVLKSCGLLEFERQVMSMPHYRDKVFSQDLITLANWPHAYEDVGKIEPIICGSDLRVPAQKVDWGAQTTLAYGINAAVFEPNPNVTLPTGDLAVIGIMLSIPERFPSAGSLVIDGERIGYTGIDSHGNLTGVTRGMAMNGAASDITDHNTGATIWEYKAAYDSLVARHELQSVGNIYARINNQLVKVLAGVSVVVVNGKTILRAASQIGIDQALANTLGLNPGSHFHPLAGGNATVWGNGGSSGELWDQSTSLAHNGYGKVNFGGYADNLADWNVKINYSGQGSMTVHGGDWYKNFTLSQANQFVTVGWAIGRKCPASVEVWPSGPGINITEIWLENNSTATASAAALGIQLTGSVAYINTLSVERFYIDCNGAASDNPLFGPAGSVIELPGYEIARFIVKDWGFPVDDIDPFSFARAKDRYSKVIVGGYTFGYRTADNITPSQWVAQMAYECRSTCRYVRGKWYLDYIEDSLPQALKTIESSRLVGSGAEFTFSEGQDNELWNSYTAKFCFNDAKVSDESDWLGTVDKPDDPLTSVSIGKHGRLHKDIELKCIRTLPMAAHVLGQKLKETEYLPLNVQGVAPFENFDLRPGDIFRIKNEIYNNRLFYMESFARDAKDGAAMLRGRDCWGGVQLDDGTIIGAGSDRPQPAQLTGTLQASVSISSRTRVSLSKCSLIFGGYSGLSKLEADSTSQSRVF